LAALNYPRFRKGPFIKDVGGRGLSSADKEGVGFFRCGCPHFLAQKTSDFFIMYGVSARTRGWASADKGGGGQFCADVLYGRPLTRNYL